MEGNTCFLFRETGERLRRKESDVFFFYLNTAGAEGGTKIVVRWEFYFFCLFVFYFIFLTIVINMSQHQHTSVAAVFGVASTDRKMIKSEKPLNCSEA